MTELLVLRPEPGASETLARARALGLDAVAAPLFGIAPLAWQAPDASRFDAVMLTSANAARHGGEKLAAFVALPVFAVGERTAAAAREAGFGDIRAGPGDAAGLLQMMAASGVERAFHPCGRDRRAAGHPAIAVEHRAVYAAQPADTLPGGAEQALAAGALALVHSPRAAGLFATLVRRAGLPLAAIRVAAISDNAARGLGSGWGRVEVAAAPRDEALLELARRLCHSRSAGADGME